MLNKEEVLEAMKVSLEIQMVATEEMMKGGMEGMNPNSQEG